MTKAKGPWGTCSWRGCDRRIRSDNSSGYCRSHANPSKHIYADRKRCLAPLCETQVMVRDNGTDGFCQAHRFFRKNHKRSTNTSRSKVTQWLAAYKMERGCMDCAYRKHFSALQLDHTGPKTAEFGAIRSSVKRIQAEIESGQAVVRCANCHSIKTWAERNGHSNPSGFCHEEDQCEKANGRYSTGR
jgi:hypothetical protein